MSLLRTFSLVWVYPKHVGRHWDIRLVPLSTLSSSSSSSPSSTSPQVPVASSSTGQGWIDPQLSVPVSTITVPVNSTTESSSAATTTSATTDTATLATTTTIASPSNTFPYKLPPWLERVLELWKKQSGTSEVLQLKQDVSLKSQAFDAATARVTHSRRHLDQTMLVWERINSQHLQLLQRRETWTAVDAQQFATLMGQEVETRTQMEQARTELAQAEATLSQSQWEYMNAMRKRYHEEQIWQDQWRVLGTYGTWSLILLNSCVFLLSQFFHYRREARKMKHLETLVKENVASQQAFKDSMIAERQAFAQTSGGATATTVPSDQQAVHTTTTTTGAVDASSTSSSTTTTSSTTEERELPTTITTADAQTVNGELLDPPPVDHSTTPSTQPSGRFGLAGTWAWLQSIQETKWIQAIVASDLVQSTVQQTKGILATSKAQTQEFLQEVHLPSALLGASVTGVAVIATMLLTSSSSSSSSSSWIGRGGR